MNGIANKNAKQNNVPSPQPVKVTAPVMATIIKRQNQTIHDRAYSQNNERIYKESESIKNNSSSKIPEK